MDLILLKTSRGSTIPDANQVGNTATLSEMSVDQKNCLLRMFF